MKTALKIMLVAGVFGSFPGLVQAQPAPQAAPVTAEDIIQRQLGQLMISNANAATQINSLSADLQKARAEIEELKKQLTAAQPRKNGPAPGDTVK